MLIAACILTSVVTGTAAFAAYVWYVTPDPKDLVEEVLCHSRRARSRAMISAGSIFASRPQANMTHINCLS